MFSNSSNEKKIIDAARANNFEMVFSMLDSSPNLITSNYTDWSFNRHDLIICAIKNKNVDAFTRLLETKKIDSLIDQHVCKPNQRFKPGEEPEGRRMYFVSNFLHFVCGLSETSTGIIHAVLEKKRHDINEYRYFYSNIGGGEDSNDGIHNRNYATALCIAAKLGNVDVVTRLLQEEDIDVNKCEKDYDLNLETKSALYIASEEGNTEIVKVLLAHPKILINQGCRTSYTSSDSTKSPLDAAISNGHQEISNLLCDAMKIDKIRLSGPSCVIL